MPDNKQVNTPIPKEHKDDTRVWNAITQGKMFNLILSGEHMLLFVRLPCDCLLPQHMMTKKPKDEYKISKRPSWSERMRWQNIRTAVVQEKMVNIDVTEWNRTPIVNSKTKPGFDSMYTSCSALSVICATPVHQYNEFIKRLSPIRANDGKFILKFSLPVTIFSMIKWKSLLTNSSIILHNFVTSKESELHRITPRSKAKQRRSSKPWSIC